MTHSSRNPLLSVKWPTSPKNSMHADDIKTWMTENHLKLNDDETEALLFPFSSSLKPSTVPLPDSITLGSHNIPVLRFCQEPWIHSWLKTVHEKARHKKSAKLLISSLNALVQSASFSLKTQLRLLLLPISFHGLTTATVSLWVHLILSSNLSRNFKTFLKIRSLGTLSPPLSTSLGKTALASHFRTY